VGATGILLAASAPTLVAASWTETVIHGFTGGAHGNNPIYGTLVQDASGALYGTASGEGSSEKAAHGIIYRLTPASKNGSKWTFSSIYSFPHSHSVGPGYAIGGLTIDAEGNLYGTTTVGLVFELSPPAAGSTVWTYTTIANLESQMNNTLVGSLLLSSSGALFGVSIQSAANANGSIFELVPPSGGNGPWTYNLLYAFQPITDGAHPAAGLITDAQGNLYGTTASGGPAIAGTVFELVAPTAGQTAWTESVLYAFNGGTTDGSTPVCSLLFDASGALYGTTYQGGKYDSGTIFKLTPPAPGSSTWSESLLHDFAGPGAEGPNGGLIADAQGNLYGSTVTGPNTVGTVFKLTPPGGSKTKWAFKTLWSFPTSSEDGVFPQGNLFITALGDLYGTTELGGPGPCTSPSGCGTVFQVAP